MFYPILFAILLKIAYSFHRVPIKNSHISYDYDTPSWVYENVYNHNKPTKSSIEKLKNKNDIKNQDAFNKNDHYISEYDANYNAIISCKLPLGLLQQKSD